VRPLKAEQSRLRILKSAEVQKQPKARRGVNMDLGPIAGIRSVSLLNAQRAKREGTPSFEIDSSARADDQHTSSQEPPDRRRPEDDHPPEPEQAAAENQQPEAIDDAEGQHNWFV
jgi:hypothetical protein